MTVYRHLGILGTGQLGRMLAQAAASLDIQCSFYGNGDATPVDGLGDVFDAAYTDREALFKFVSTVEAVSYEFENIDTDFLHEVAARIPFAPTVRALEVSQDRLTEKRFFNQLGAETAPFAPIPTGSALTERADALAYPCLLKTRRLGYDGKGQFRIHNPEDVRRAWSTLGSQSLILEGMVHFDAEYSIIAARDRSGRIAYYPLVENTHHAGILRVSCAPIQVPSAIEEQARALAAQVLEELSYVGVLAIELFAIGDRLLVNEMAPRVHNSGHWTIEGTTVSQFENHVRCVAGMEVKTPEPTGFSVMVNAIGERPTLDVAAQAKATLVGLHDYQKSLRVNRKIGHVTYVYADEQARNAKADAEKASLVTDSR